MKKENLSVLTFMSWDNGYEKDIRAIALCEPDGYFNAAINCMRDGDMGKKDENGVYERIWYGDYIENDNCENVRPATQSETELYLKYVPLESAVGLDYTDINTNIVCKCFGRLIKHVIVEYKPIPWYVKLWNRIIGNKNRF